MIQSSPEIEAVIANASDLAKHYNHEYVTLEHLAHGLVSFKPFNELLIGFGADAEGLLLDLEQYLERQTYLVQDIGIIPKKTHSLERVFNRALTQVLFSGRNHIQVIDLFLSIASEVNSHANYFFIKYGLERSQVVDFYNKNYVESKGRRVAPDARADEKIGRAHV